MKTKTRLLLLLTFLFTPAAHANVDYKCQSDCTSRGYTYQYCSQACSYQPQHHGSNFGNLLRLDNVPVLELPNQNNNRRTDARCMSNCQQQGYGYGYCQNRCQY